MSEQQTIPEFSQPAPATPQAAPAPVWLQRTSLMVFVMFCCLIGGLLAVLPWSPSFWDQNGWMLSHPAINAYLQRGWLRGTISGIGLIDIWIAFSELLHYRDYRPARP